jgi:dTDP-4-dehydrorhamnose reductase
MKKKILIFGHGSLVGSRVVEQLHQSFDLYGASRFETKVETARLLKRIYKADISDKSEVESIFAGHKFDYVINFAAMTNVDEIEKNRPKNMLDIEELESNDAYTVNTLGVKNILESAKAHNVFPIFISTETVFDGKDGPYDDNTKVAENLSDLSWYACTKLLAEQEINKSGIENIIIRISYPYRKSYQEKNDFIKNFIKLYEEYSSGKRAEIYPIFDDQTITLTYIDDISLAIVFALEKNLHGVVNLSSPSITTPYKVFCEILRAKYMIENPEEIVPKGNIVEFQAAKPTFAKRPVKSGLISSRLINLGFTPTDWKDGLRQII